MTSVKTVKSYEGIPVLGIGIQGDKEHGYTMHVFPIVTGDIGGDYKVLNRCIMARSLNHGLVGEILDSIKSEKEVAEDHLRNRLKLFSLEKKDITEENCPSAVRYNILYHGNKIGKIIPNIGGGSVASVKLNYDGMDCNFIAVQADNNKVMIYDKISEGLKPYGFVDLLPIK